MSRQVKITAICAIAAVILFFSLRSRLNPIHENSFEQKDSHQSEVSVQEASSKKPLMPAGQSSTTVAGQINKTNQSDTNSPIELTEETFESNVLSCFRGEHCQLKEKPSKLYKDFKNVISAA